jgi:heme-degrading monooxygenase HmoA
MSMSTPTRRAALATLLATAASRVGHAEATGATPVHQLRIYEIFDHNKAAFHARFRDHAARIMRRHGFDIAAMWEARGEAGPEFVYLLRWPDEAAMTACWVDFIADEEWSRIKDETAAQHGALVGRIKSRVLQLTPYSAAPD